MKEKLENDIMSRLPAYIAHKEIPDEQLLNRIRDMVKDGKSPKKMKSELSNVSLYIIYRYYTKIRRGIW